MRLFSSFSYLTIFLLIVSACSRCHAQTAPTTPDTASSTTNYAYSVKAIHFPVKLADDSVIYERDYCFNDKGEVVVFLHWATNRKGGSNGVGIFTPDKEIVKAGDVVDGQKIIFPMSYQVNNAGQVAYLASLVSHRKGVPAGLDNRLFGVFIGHKLIFRLPIFVDGSGYVFLSDSGRVYYAQNTLFYHPEFTGKGNVITSDGIHWHPWKALPAGIRDSRATGQRVDDAVTGFKSLPGLEGGISDAGDRRYFGPAGFLGHLGVESTMNNPGYPNNPIIIRYLEAGGVRVQEHINGFSGLEGSYMNRQGQFLLPLIKPTEGIFAYVATPGQVPADAIELTQATTTDAQSVSVNYTIKQVGVKSVDFAVYRSPVPTIDEGTAKPIKEQTISDEGDLTQGDHKGVKIIDGTELKPDTAKEYVIVVAKCNGEESTTYFRKWMLGALAHGYDPYTRIVPRLVPDWESTMAGSLHGIDEYDKVIAYDWEATCAIPKSDMAQEAGFNLEGLIIQWATANKHKGDVVDIHFIGHSRGAVVVTQALKFLSQHDSSFGGGYVEVTLLDPHPANDNFGQWGSFAKYQSGPLTGQMTVLASAHYVTTNTFQSNANDPSLELPAGIKKLDIWYQHTNASYLSGDESLMNLWGIVDGRAYKNDSGLDIQQSEHELTTDGEGVPAIGHSEVPGAYEQTIVDKGNLNHSP